MSKYLILSCLPLVLGVSTPGVAFAQKSRPTMASKSQATEALCRIKAKEFANEAFTSCMNNQKSNEIDKIRQEYQDKLSRMKAEYEAELSKISGRKKEKDSLLNNQILDESTPESSENEEASSHDAQTDLHESNGVQDSPVESADREAPKTPRAKAKSKLAFQSQSRAAKSRAILFTELTEIPEPVPMDAEGNH